MPPRARKKSQRGIRRSDAPCSESKNQRIAAGTLFMSVSNYTETQCMDGSGAHHGAHKCVVASDSRRRTENLFLLQRCRSCLGSLSVLLLAEPAISLREQTQSLDISWISFGERLEIGQS